MEDFKIGDRVQVINNDDIQFMEFGILIGDTGVVTEIRRETIRLKFDENGTEEANEFNKGYGWYRERFKLLEMGK